MPRLEVVTSKRIMPRRSTRFRWSPELGFHQVDEPLALTNGITKWPIHSDSMGINPSQVSTAQAVLASHGVKTEYDREGRPVLTDAGHRKRHAEALGFFDRNGGYSDPQRQGHA